MDTKYQNWAQCDRYTHTAEVSVISRADIPLPQSRAAYLATNGLDIPSIQAPLRAQSPNKVEQCYVIDLHDAIPNPEEHVAASFVRKVNEPPAEMAASRIAPDSPRNALHMRPAQGIHTKNSFGKLSKKFRLIKDLRDGEYVDLLVLIVNKYYRCPGDVELSVADFTENQQLFNRPHPDDDPRWQLTNRDGDELGYIRTGARKWTGPYGYRTLLVKLWSPHAEAAYKDFSEGDIVFLGNVHIKFSPSAKLEGVMHGDRAYPDKIGILSPREDAKPFIKDLNERREQYEKEQERNEQKKTKKQKQRERKMQAQEKAQRSVQEHQQKEVSDKAPSTARTPEREQATSIVESANRHGTCSVFTTVFILMKIAKLFKVRSGNPDIQVTSLEDILDSAHRKYKAPSGEVVDLPFINAKWRVRVRVVDFFPDALEDFAHTTSDQAKDDDSDVEMDMDMAPSGKRWEWGFCLLVEDAKLRRGRDAIRIPLYVSNKSAQYLLKMDACDLRAKPHELSKLQEKLCVIWGNLEEVKQVKAAPTTESAAKRPRLEEEKVDAQNVAFECCLEEYGVQANGPGNGWEPIRHMFETTIM